jgi:aspartyl-tRNA(Asn)/glutamyl-tRNA(Gln) amidotransferase subunit C
MSLDKTTVRKIAKLARLRVAEELEQAMVGELNAILAFVEQLNQLDTSGVPPMTSVVEMRLRMRADEVTEGGDPEAVLANTPERAGDFFLVPKVVG